MKIAIIGAGFGGMAAAWDLARAGHEVSLYEAGTEVGGLAEIVGERYPRVPAGPWVLAFTATDSRYFRAAGIPSYGFSPFPFVATETYTGDDRNERVSLGAYVEGVRLYSDLVRRLAG